MAMPKQIPNSYQVQSENEHISYQNQTETVIHMTDELPPSYHSVMKKSDDTIVNPLYNNIDPPYNPAFMNKNG